MKAAAGSRAAVLSHASLVSRASGVKSFSLVSAWKMMVRMSESRRLFPSLSKLLLSRRRRIWKTNWENLGTTGVPGRSL
eukprot:14792136-Heterocapsa_arctica.AAC.1